MEPAALNINESTFLYKSPDGLRCCVENISSSQKHFGVTCVSFPPSVRSSWMKCAVTYVGSRTPCSTLVTSSPGAACPSPASWTPTLQRATLVSKRQTLPLRPWTTCLRRPRHPNSAGEKPSVVSGSCFVVVLFVGTAPHALSVCFQTLCWARTRKGSRRYFYPQTVTTTPATL